MDSKNVIRIAEDISLNFANRSDESTLIEFAEAIAAAEREECAEFAEGATAYTQFQTIEHYKISAFIAAAIRERSNA